MPDSTYRLKRIVGFLLPSLLLSLVLSNLPTSAQDAANNRPVTDKWAVVIGISKFANPSLNLRYPSKDATDFYKYLVEKGNFAKDHVLLLRDQQATRDNIMDVLGDSWLPRVTLPDDLVVIFISSHGSSSDFDIRGVNYIVAHDTNPEKLFVTGIPMKDLADLIRERVHSDRVLVVLDTCHAGGAAESKGLARVGNADAALIAQGSGQMVICSSDKNQTSWESKDYPNSVFTRSLIDSLQSAGINGDVNSVFDLVKDKVQSEVVRERGVLQTPVLEASKWSGKDLVVNCPPVKPRPVPIGLRRTVEQEVVSSPSKELQNTTPPAVTSVAVAPPVVAPPVVSPTRQSPLDFLRYHFAMVGSANYDAAWADLSEQYKAKYQSHKDVYARSVSRRKILQANAPQSEFRVMPTAGGQLPVRVRMNLINGYNGVWIYYLVRRGEQLLIQDVTTFNGSLNAPN